MADAGTPRRRIRPAHDTHGVATGGPAHPGRQANRDQRRGSISSGRTHLIGGDPSRVSRAQVDLWLDGLDAARDHPERLAGTATAFASIIKAMFITQRSTNEALDAVRVPVLVLWGTDDHLIDPTSLLQHARRPGWTPRPIDDVGHLLPVEAPQIYAQAVRQWLADSRDTRGFGHPT